MHICNLKKGDMIIHWIINRVESLICNRLRKSLRSYPMF